MSKSFSFIKGRLNAIDLISDTADPRTGVAAPIGSKYYRGTATAGDFTKTAAADTAWTPVATGIYFNVKDPAYGATGDGVTDDRAAIQLAINDAAVSGGTVYFPPGTYLCGKSGANPYSFNLNNIDGVRFLGCGYGGAVVKQSGNAGAGAYSLFLINGGSNSTEFELLTFDQSGLSNVGADLCPLINIADAFIVKFITCRFTGGVATAGAYIKIGGTAASTVELVWVDSCELRDAGGPNIWIDGGTVTSKIWVIDSSLVQTVSEDENLLIANTVGGAVSDIKAMGCHLENDQKWAAHVLCSSGTLERVQVSGNALMGFFASTNADKVQFQDNTVSCAVSGIADACVLIEDGTHLQVQNNYVHRAITATDGPVCKIDTCTRAMVQGNAWAQETTGTDSRVVHLVDSTFTQLQNNTTTALDADTNTTDCYLLESVAVVIDAIQVTNECISADANTWENAIHVLSNGADIGSVQITGGNYTACDVGVFFDAPTAGDFTDFLMVAGVLIDATTAAYSVSVTGVYIRIGSNACTFGAQMIAGNDTPEGNVTARIGSLYQRLDGGAATTLYVKESGTGSAGWTAK